jgi:flagellar hook-basal body complex protein FliE
MSLISPVNQLMPSLQGKLSGLMPPELSGAGIKALETQPFAAPGSTSGVQSGGFSAIFQNLIEAVDTKQQSATEVTKQVLLGQNDQLHQSVIAMQEASVAFSLMVEVRNKLVDSYQELMRIPV